MSRRQRGFRAIVVLFGLVMASAAGMVALAFVAADKADRLNYIAVVLVGMAIVLVYQARKTIDELDGGRILLDSESKFRQVVEYGVIGAVGGVTLLSDAGARLVGLSPPWKFPFGSFLFAAFPAVLLSYYLLVPWLCRTIGIGATAALNRDE